MTSHPRHRRPPQLPGGAALSPDDESVDDAARDLTTLLLLDSSLRPCSASDTLTAAAVPSEDDSGKFVVFSLVPLSRRLLLTVLSPKWMLLNSLSLVG
jgi:hypothetical protein